MKYGISKKMVPVMLLTFLLSGCDKKDEDPTQIPEKFKPELNPHPKYFFTFKGRVDKALFDKLDLKVSATYVTANKDCEAMINWLAGVTSPRRVDLEETVKFNKNGHFYQRVALDKYKKGKCGWSIEGASYLFFYDKHKYEDGVMGVSFINSDLVLKKPLNLSWQCDADKCILITEDLVHQFDSISKRQSVISIANFTLKGGVGG